MFLLSSVIQRHPCLMAQPPNARINRREHTAFNQSGEDNDERIAVERSD
jgi:hypothetical protein